MALYRHEFAVCPWCNGDTGRRVDHLYGDQLPRKAGPWYCEACGRPFTVTVNAPSDVIVEQAPTANTKLRTLVLLTLKGSDPPLFFVVEGMRWPLPNDPHRDEQDVDRYFYEQHSCPTNWIRDTAAVIENGDTDPHGFLTFVRSIEIPHDFDYRSDEWSDDDQWAVLFPEAFPGQTIDGSVVRGLLDSPND